MTIWVVDCDCGPGKNDFAMLFYKRPQANEGMGERRNDLPCHCCRRKRGCQGKGGAGHRAFDATVGHVDSNGRSVGFVVGDWGIRSKVEVVSAGVSDANVISR